MICFQIWPKYQRGVKAAAFTRAENTASRPISAKRPRAAAPIQASGLGIPRLRVEAFDTGPESCEQFIAEGIRPRGLVFEFGIRTEEFNAHACFC